MKTKKNEKKLELKKITISNLNNQDMGIVRGGCFNTSHENEGTPECRVTRPPKCPF